MNDELVKTHLQIKTTVSLLGDQSEGDDQALELE